MKNETILRAVGAARADYLDHALERPAEKPRRLVRPVARIAVIAAVMVLLVTSAFAAWSAWSMGSRKLSDNWYEMYFQENPAAADAPETLEQYYLPAALPEGYTRDFSRVTYGDAFSTESAVSWVYGDPDAQQSALVDEWTKTWTRDENGAPLPLTEDQLAVLEKEHPIPSVKIQEVSFSQKPLLSLPKDNVFDTLGGRDLGEMVRGGTTLNGVAYVTMTHTGEDGDSTWYYWVDDACHYVFSMYFTAGIPQADREAILSSVAPVDREAYLAIMGIGSRSVWLADAELDGYTAKSVALIVGKNGKVNTMSDWQDGAGHVITCSMGNTYTDEDFANAKRAEFTVNGTPVTSFVSEENADGQIWRDENWYFIAPDGVTHVWINFLSCDNVELPQTLKESVLESIRAVDPTGLVK